MELLRMNEQDTEKWNNGVKFDGLVRPLRQAQGERVRPIMVSLSNH